MRQGDMVIGIPVNSETRKLHPTVTGRYTVAHFNFLNKEHHIDLILLEDGSTVDCTDVRPVG